MKNEELIDTVDLKWSISRGKETLGYNIVSLRSQIHNKYYRACGGGYDLTGSALGAYVAKTYQAELKKLVETHKSEAKLLNQGWYGIDKFYGLSFNDKATVFIDGACGERSVQLIAESIGLRVNSHYNKRGHCTGFSFYKI